MEKTRASLVLLFPKQKLIQRRENEKLENRHTQKGRKSEGRKIEKGRWE